MEPCRVLFLELNPLGWKTGSFVKLVSQIQGLPKLDVMQEAQWIHSQQSKLGAVS